MTKKSELAVIDLDKIDVNKLPELANFKERGEKLVKECSFVEIKDNASYELAKKNRTALRTFRTDVEKSDKAIKSKLNNFKNRVGEVSASLIAITEPSEKTQQEEVERYEQIKENERLEKLRLEQERVDNIKKKIGEFRQHWENQVSYLTFEVIEDVKDLYSVAVVEFDRDSLAEFDVLFTDSVNYLDNIFEARIKTLTEQEEIRLEQIRLAEEREKQRIEAERIAEEQRKEREAIEAKQKAEEEKIRLAKEAFEKEKREFEEKQAEARFQERCKQLTDLGFDMAVFELEHKGDPRWMNLKTSAKIESDSDWAETIEWVKLRISERENSKKDESVVIFEIDEYGVKAYEEAKFDQSAEEDYVEYGRLIEKDGVLWDTHLNEPFGAEKHNVILGKSDESAKENYHESDVDPKGFSTRLKANTPMPEKELTWDLLYDEGFKNSKEYRTSPSSMLLGAFFDYLKTNYNCPTRKI